MLQWSTCAVDKVVPPGAAVQLLKRAIAASPRSANLHTQLGSVYLDRFEFGQAAESFESALQCDPTSLDILARLTRSWNRLARHADVLTLLAATNHDHAEIHVQHGVAFAALDRVHEAEGAFELALHFNPRHSYACFRLCQILRGNGRFKELLALCGRLSGQGVAHAQLLLDWGRALAFDGQIARARCLLFDHAKMVRLKLPAPAGFDDVDAFNRELAAELATNDHPITNMPMDELATRGSALILHLLDGKRPALVRALIKLIQTCIERCLAEAASTGTDFDPWGSIRPTRTRLRPWGLIQKSGDHEEWHTHRSGWMSGVYYVQIPEAFSADGDGAGCIEFGYPPSLAKAGLAGRAPLRVAPTEGLLLLTPSHYHHRTIPFVSSRQRISVAFDVIDLDAHGG